MRIVRYTAGIQPLSGTNGGKDGQLHGREGGHMRAGLGLAAGGAVLVTALAGCGSGGQSAGGSQYTYWSNPCVTSRIATGDWQQKKVNYQIPLVGAACDCALRAS